MIFNRMSRMDGLRWCRDETGGHGDYASQQVAGSQSIRPMAFSPAVRDGTRSRCPSVKSVVDYLFCELEFVFIRVNSWFKFC